MSSELLQVVRPGMRRSDDARHQTFKFSVMVLSVGNEMTHLVFELVWHLQPHNCEHFFLMALGSRVVIRGNENEFKPGHFSV